MFNLFDILQTQGGGMQSFGQQFGLSPDQSRRAMEALLPALTIGLQRNAASDPAGFGRLFGLAGADTSSGSRSQPDLLLSQLFGSPALSQAVLQQAAASSGIGTQALKQMLPMMAGMVVAGIVHTLLNQPPPAAPAREPDPPLSPAFAAADFWNDWMSSMLASTSGTTEAARPPQKAPPPSPPPAPAVEKALPKPEAATSGEATDDAQLEVFQQMFQTGVQVQEQNVKAMQDIFDSFWSAKGGPAANDEAEPPKPAAEAKKPRGGKAKSGAKGD